MKAPAAERPGAPWVLAVELRGVAKNYEARGERVLALHQTDLQVRRGELLVILGSSGSGKTTLLHGVAGLISFDTGEVRLHGKVATHAEIRDRGIAMVLQSLGLYTRKSVRENVGYPLKLARVPEDVRRTRTDSLLRLLKIEDLGDRYPGQLSGGQRQRVAIARALAREADILLLDEPFSDLDAGLRYVLRGELKSLHLERGLTTILVTHDQEDALSLGDRIALMHQGRIVEVNHPLELYRHPDTVFAGRFLGRPPMNLFEVAGSDGEFYAPQLGAALPIRFPAPLALPGLGAVTLGVRPEQLEIGAEGGAWTVSRVETAGFDQIVHLVLGPLQVACRTAAERRIEPGDRVGLVARGSPHLFDSRTGERLK